MELATHNINREGRISFHICLNFSAAVGTVIISDGDSSIFDNKTGLLREGSLTVKRIMKPMMIPGRPAIIKDLL
jgi:hypothetical protein